MKALMILALIGLFGLARFAPASASAVGEVQRFQQLETKMVGDDGGAAGILYREIGRRRSMLIQVEGLFEPSTELAIGNKRHPLPTNPVTGFTLMKIDSFRGDDVPQASMGDPVAILVDGKVRMRGRLRPRSL